MTTESMKPYPAYKDSGIEWIGEIPEGWNVKKLKHLSSINPTKSNSNFNKNSEELVTFLPMEYVSEDGYIDTKLKRPIKDLWSGFTYFEKNDIIVSKITPCFENGKGAYLENLNSKIGFGSTEFHVLRAKTSVINPHLIYYNTRNYTFKKLGEAAMIGAAGQKRVPNSFIENYYVCYPAKLKEQDVITNFLDSQTAKIDTLIENKQKQIELLKEERTAIINQAVTKGLNPDVPMKDSGIEWLGEVPKGWGVEKLKRVSSKITDGEHISPEFTVKGMPFLSAKDVRYRNININVDKYVSWEDGVGFRKRCNPDRGDILIVSRGATIGRIGLVETDKSFCLLGSVILIKPKLSNIQSIFLYYLLNQSKVQERLLLTSQSSAQQAIYIINLSELVISIPPISEQSNIAAFLGRETERIDTLTTKVYESISKLHEYRTALISEAVTGKIDLRNQHEIPTPQ